MRGNKVAYSLANQKCVIVVSEEWVYITFKKPVASLVVHRRMAGA